MHILAQAESFNSVNFNTTPWSVRVAPKADEFGEKFPIGMAYVPWQAWRDIYDMEKGLQRGTIFAELDLPFEGQR